ncbi:MAG TPA: DUF2959 domain-containing protein [Oligoflexia bacterium]|nr:DUF2959 domain-containing protein [Oligoflexia bacterium]
MTRKSCANQAIVLCFSLFILCSCSKAYYKAMESLGYPKRDLMISRVKDAKKTQQDAKEQFRSALERFKSVVKMPGGRLEAKYEQLNSELERSESKAKEVKQRIAAVEDVSEALFSEWRSELKEYKNQDYRRISERKLEDTRRRYEQLIRAMKNAESRIEPVLQPMRDNVLFLKHNLNAEALSSLGGELRSVESNVDYLIADLERSIAESDQFIREIGKEP